MNREEALSKMVAPGTRRQGKWRGGVIQIWVTRACDKSCFSCTQGSNLGGNPGMMSVAQFEEVCKSLRGYFGVVGMFGGNPALHPQFDKLCEVMKQYVPYEQRGLWCNNPNGKGAIMRDCFNPAVSNLNVHLDQKAYDEFRRDWPECRPFGLHEDSRHSPPYVAMKDVLLKDCPNVNCDKGQVKQSPFWNDGPTNLCNDCNGTGTVYDESKAWELISKCDINQHWSAMIGVFRGEVRAWFCEIAGAQAMLHQHEPDYPDTGIELFNDEFDSNIDVWWKLPMSAFANQVDKHCHDCGVPLRGYGNLAQAESGTEQCSKTHENVYKLKTKGRSLSLITDLEALKPQALERITNYLDNAKV